MIALDLRCSPPGSRIDGTAGRGRFIVPFHAQAVKTSPLPARSSLRAEQSVVSTRRFEALPPAKVEVKIAVGFEVIAHQTLHVSFLSAFAINGTQNRIFESRYTF
jgi:hypothetical protein